jgi:mono/diheme cytochrome c family protein
MARIFAQGAGFVRAAALLWTLAVPAFAYAQAGVAKAPGAADTYAGEFEFRLYCAQCHGMGAIGNGPVAAALKKRPANLTLLTRSHGGVFPEKEIRDFIDGTSQVAVHGSREMPIWGLAFQYREGGAPSRSGAPAQSAQEIDRKIGLLVDYIKTIQAK